MSKIIDLHIHSTYSDGQLTPKEIVEEAIKNNVGLMSITDHDDIRSSIYIKNNITNLDISYINGIELSTITSIGSKKYKIHTLGYGYDETNEVLQKKLLELKQKREITNIKYLEKMCKCIDFLDSKIINEIDNGKYITFSKKMFKYLKDNNYTEDEIKKVLNYTSENKIIYQDYDINDEEAISLLLGAGAIPVLAHPYQYKLSENEEKELLRKLKVMGLMGLEVYHSGDTLDGMRLQEKLCKQEDLLYSAGSDFHTVDNDHGNKIGLGKSNNLLIEDCSVIKELEKTRRIYR